MTALLSIAAWLGLLFVAASAALVGVVIWIALGESDARDDAARDAGQPLHHPPATP